MLSAEWRTLARKYIAYDIPTEMAACFDCGAVRCLGDVYEACPVRLARATAAQTARMPEGSFAER